MKTHIKKTLLLTLIITLTACDKNEGAINGIVFDPPIYKIPENFTLSMGVFGGSVSVLRESETAKSVWKKYLNVEITSCGVGGAGFSAETSRMNIPAQIEKAGAFDIYILWASTNDMAKSKLGNVELRDETTQDGGILQALEQIRKKNQNALILFFTSMPRFDREFYIRALPAFVDDQIAICQKNKILYFDQYRLCGFNKNNFQQYYIQDQIHLNNEGYAKIAMMQMEFIREQIRIFYQLP